MVYVTNMSRLTVSQQQERLVRCGVHPPMEIVTSATAAASLVGSGERVLVCGGEGIVEAVEAVGGVVVRNPAGAPETAEPLVDAVVVGMDPGFDYAACGRAMRAVRAGARLIGTNHDPTYPTRRASRPGAAQSWRRLPRPPRPSPSSPASPTTPRWPACGSAWVTGRAW